MEKSFLKAPKTGAVKVPHHKITEHSETRDMPAVAKVTLLMSQHIGKPAVRCVEKGDAVYVGSVVGRADGFVSAAVHAPISGKVLDIVRVITPAGSEVEAVVVENDYKDTVDAAIRKPNVRTAKDLVDAIAQSGLVGLGGAGFPTHVKFSPPQDAVLDTLVINGAECEPYITADHREMVENADDVIEGTRIIRDLLGLERAVIGIEKNKPDAIRILTEKAAPHGIEIRALQSLYPQGAEKVLIARLTGRAMPIGGLPSDAGVVIVNVSTAAFVASYLKTGMPLLRKRVTVSGDAVAEPANLMVPVGTPLADIIAACGGYAGQPAKLIVGGPMMGVAMYSDDFPLLKSNNGLLAFSEKLLTPTDENPCIRCGRCSESCPVLLAPAEIQVLQVNGDLEQMEKLETLSCIECGCCTYVCPAKRPVTQIMRLAKADLRKAASKK